MRAQGRQHRGSGTRRGPRLCPRRTGTGRHSTSSPDRRSSCPATQCPPQRAAEQDRAGLLRRQRRQPAPANTRRELSQRLGGERISKNQGSRRHKLTAALTGRPPGRRSVLGCGSDPWRTAGAQRCRWTHPGHPARSLALSTRASPGPLSGLLGGQAQIGSRLNAALFGGQQPLKANWLRVRQPVGTLPHVCLWMFRTPLPKTSRRATG